MKCTLCRCRHNVHRMTNSVAKLPEDAVDDFRQAAKAAYEAPSPAMARALRADLVERFGKEYTSAVTYFEEDLERLRDQLVNDHRQRNASAVTVIEPVLTFPAGLGFDPKFHAAGCALDALPDLEVLAQRGHYPCHWRDGDA